MPVAALHPCAEAGCPELLERGTARCPKHDLRRQRGSSTQQGYGQNWRRMRAAFLAANPWCGECGAPSTEADHKTPRSQGGSDDWDNLQAMCKSCHSRKTATKDGGWGNEPLRSV